MKYCCFSYSSLRIFSAHPWFFSVLQSWLCQWRCQKVFFMLLFIMKRTPYKRTCMAIKISLYICLNVNLDKEKTLKITFFLFFLSFGRPQISIKATVRLSKMQLSLWNYYSCILKLCQSIPFLVNKICVVVSFNNKCIPFKKNTASFFNVIFRSFDSLNINKECCYYDVMQVYLNLYLKSNMMSKIYSKN